MEIHTEYQGTSIQIIEIWDSEFSIYFTCTCLIFCKEAVCLNDSLTSCRHGFYQLSEFMLSNSFTASLTASLNLS